MEGWLELRRGGGSGPPSACFSCHWGFCEHTPLSNQATSPAPLVDSNHQFNYGRWVCEQFFFFWGEGGT